MAYPAVITLKHTITKLQYYSIIIIDVDYELNRLKAILESLNQTKNRSVDMSAIYALDAQIQEAVYKLEDVVESYLLHRRHSLPPGQIRHVDDECLMQEIDSFAVKATDLGEEYERELCKQTIKLSEDDVFCADNPSTTVDLPDQVHQILEKLLDFEYGHTVVSLVGMAGIGKTHLAREIYQHPLIAQHFHVKAWARVGRKNQARKVLVEILAQIECKPRDVYVEQETGKLAKHLRKRLRGLRSIIFFDDIWSEDDLIELTRMFRRDEVRFFLTTRIEYVASGYFNMYRKRFYDPTIHHMRFLNNEESWKLFRENVFVDEYCSPELEIAGKKITENCEGLPLLILAVVDILRGLDKTVEYWNEVAEMKTTTFPDAYERIWDVLYSSYEFLPQHLKPCFLYMGVFPQRFEILRSRLIKLWTAEDFLHKTHRDMILEVYFKKCLDGVVGNSLAIRCKKSSNGGIKSFRIHSAYWYLCFKEASKIKFFHVLKKSSDTYIEGIENQRRLSVQNNVLLGIKEAHDSMAAVQKMRSLLITGEYHQYPVPVCLDLVFLKVLEALAIRFYEFPTEVLKLLQLKYLALTHNGVVPSSISNLQQLQSLILRQHHNITFVGDSTCLPNEIWDMEELKHIRTIRSNLPDPTNRKRLWNLSTLCVDAHSCTKLVLRSLPYLRKLGIYIELLPDDAGTPSCFEHVNLLEELESLTCVVVNPRVVAAPPNHLPNLPNRLKKLNLSGLGYPWDYITTIGSLPELEALKLRCYAFRGPEWRIKDGEFRQLKFLLLEDMDLVQWTTDDDCEPTDCIHYNNLFRNMQHLIIRHCYKLKAIPWQMGRAHHLKTIELVECRSSVMDSARKIQEEKGNAPFLRSEILVTSSWNC